jgi:hypothetical protein
MTEKKPRIGWWERRGEERRLKRERSGDSPEKVAERRKPHEPTVKDAAQRAGLGGFVGGG